MNIQSSQQASKITELSAPPAMNVNRRADATAPILSAGATDTVTISQAAKDLLAASQVSSMSDGHAPQQLSLAEIADKYDVNNMSPRGMQALANDLGKSGILSGGDALMLAFQPALNPNNNVNGAPGWAQGPDESTNFLAQWKSTLEFDKSIKNTLNIPFDQKVTDLLEKLSSLRSSSNT